MPRSKSEVLGLPKKQGTPRDAAVPEGTGTVEVHIIESERGWGQKLDEVLEFADYESAKAFADEFNSRNTEPVAPDWYMRADIHRKK